MKILLDRQDIIPNIADKDGRTPLLWGAGDDHRSVVKMLLDREDIVPNTADTDGRTPLLWAARNRHRDVVNRLLELGDLTPATTGKACRKPLSSTKERGLTSPVEPLPEWCSANQSIMMTDLTGQTAVTPTSEKQPGRTLRRRFEGHGFVLQAARINSSTGLSPPGHSESSQYPSKRARRSWHRQPVLATRRNPRACHIHCPTTMFLSRFTLPSSSFIFSMLHLLTRVIYLPILALLNFLTRCICIFS